MTRRPLEPTVDVGEGEEAPAEAGTDEAGGGLPRTPPAPAWSATESVGDIAEGSNVEASNAPTGALDSPPGVSPMLLAALRSALDLPIVERAHYAVLAEYARGGLGRIVRARDNRTGRVVAIKEILARSSDDVARRFAREALITANLQHPAIVPVYELGRWPTGEPFYAMKLVSGRSLQSVIAGCKTLDERLAQVPTVVSIAEALAYAHSRRIIHRDLKPANVLVGDLGETVVIDWGLAKVIGEAEDQGPISAGADAIVVPEAVRPQHTVAGKVMGTPSYMPPEQARGEPTDERSDVYAIGAMIYHLIAGVVPYAGRKAASSRELVAIVASEAPTPLTAREPGVPPDLATIVDKAMARDPAERYANAGELTDDLRRFTTGQLVRAHHYDRRTLLARWLRRNRAPVTVAAVLLTLLVVGGIWSVRSILIERDNAAASRDIAVQETARAEEELATALDEKGRAAETTQEWARAAMYYAAARRHHDSPASAWAAGLAEARALIPVSRHTGHTAWVRAVAIAPDGDRVASVDDAGQLRIWDPGDGHLIAARAVSAKPLYAVAFSPDGRELAVAGDDGAIRRLGANLDEVATLRGHVGRVWTLAYAPDGATLASGGEDKIVRLWPIAGGAPRELAGHAQRVYSVAFSPDGKRLATGSDDRQAWIWDLATGQHTVRGDHKAGGIRVLAFTNGGDTLITGGWDHEIRLWKGNEPVPEVWSDADVVHSAAISPSGDVLVTGGEAPAIHAWDISTHQLITSLESIGQTTAVAFSRDGRWLVTAGKAAPIAWDATAFRRLAAVGHRADVDGLAFTRDGKRFVSGASDHTIREWDVAKLVEIRRISTGTRSCPDGVVALADDTIASTCDDGTLRRWNAAGRLEIVPTKTWLRLTSLAPDAATLAMAHVGGNVMLVDVASWKIVADKPAHAHHIYGVSYAPDGRLVTASLDDHVRVWRGRELAKELDVKVETDDGVLAAALAPDGSTLAIGTQDGSVHVWDVAAAKWRVRDLGGGKLGTVWKLSFLPDGAHAITTSDDGAVRIWDAKTWAAPAVLQAGEGPALALAISPDGARIAVGYKTGAIALWNATTHALEGRIGSRTRDRGSCADLATQAWIDDAHRAIVRAACIADPRAYFARLAARTHQRLDGEIDVAWEWSANP